MRYAVGALYLLAGVEALAAFNTAPPNRRSNPVTTIPDAIVSTQTRLLESRPSSSSKAASMELVSASSGLASAPEAWSASPYLSPSSSISVSLGIIGEPDTSTSTAQVSASSSPSFSVSLGLIDETDSSSTPFPTSSSEKWPPEFSTWQGAESITTVATSSPPTITSSSSSVNKITSNTGFGMQSSELQYPTPTPTATDLNDPNPNKQIFVPSKENEQICTGRGVTLANLSRSYFSDCVALASIFGARSGHFVLGGFEPYNDYKMLGKHGTCALQVKAVDYRDIINDGTWHVGNMDAFNTVMDGVQLFDPVMGAVEGDISCQYATGGVRKLAWRMWNVQGEGS